MSDKKAEKPYNPIPLPKKKIVKGHEGAHGGSWKVAYADFVTAMLALFIVLWILGQNEQVKEAVDAYFTDPTAFKAEVKARGGKWIVGDTTKVGITPMPAPDKDELIKEEVEKIKEDIAENDFLHSISDQVKIEITAEGILIEIKDAEKFDFFPVGSTNVSPELKEVIKIITPSILQMKYPVVISGHSDARSYGSEKYTNWELSADRANAVRRELLNNGLPPEMITEIRSYADTRLKNPQDPFSAENRRVSILLKHAFVDFKVMSLSDSLASSRPQIPVEKPAAGSPVLNVKKKQEH